MYDMFRIATIACFCAETIHKKMQVIGRYGLEEQQTPQIPPYNLHLHSTSTET